MWFKGFSESLQSTYLTTHRCIHKCRKQACNTKRLHAFMKHPISCILADTMSSTGQAMFHLNCMQAP